jgi:hypothetical protein
MLQDKMQGDDSRLEINPVFDFVYKMTYAIPAGVSFAAIFWLINQKRITGSYFLQPGQWVLAGFSASQICSLTIWFAFSSQEYFLSNDPSGLFGCLIVGELTALVFPLFGVLRHTGIWRWLLASVVAAFATTGLGYLVNIVQFQTLGISAFFSDASDASDAMQLLLAITFLASNVLLLVATISDYKTGASRGWLHWVGAMMVVLYFVVLPILTRISSYLVLQSQSYGG